MARVRVRSFTVVRDAIGSGLVELEVAHPETVEGLFRALLEKYGDPLRESICDPATGEVAAFPIRLNDEIVYSTLDKDRPVKTGDVLSIIFPIGGGASSV